MRQMLPQLGRLMHIIHTSFRNINETMIPVIKLFLTAGFVLSSAAAMAVPARRDVRAVTQPDGALLNVRLVGDERNHFLLTTDNRLLLEEEGIYYFARFDAQGRTVSTGIKAAETSLCTQAQLAASVTVTDRKLSDCMRLREAAHARRLPQSGMGLFSGNFPRMGDINGLVILVEYQDVSFNTPDPLEYFDAMLNQDGFNRYRGTGCAAEYFRSNSHDMFRPHFDVLGPVKLSQNRRYYGGNDFFGQDKAPEEMVIEAVRALDDEVDFAKYDMDGDGYVDNVFIFYAGRGEASGGTAETVWPHSWNMSYGGKSITVDGKTVDRYACSNEWEGNSPDGVGTFIHEFSHVMGLPDLYDTNGILNCTPGTWSALDYGPYNNDGRTPPNYSAYERNAMGWIEPQLIDGPATIKLPSLASSNQCHLIQTSRQNEFFLIENRQNEGWDAYLPGHGMLIWHVDFNQQVFDNNTVNNNSRHQYVEIIKANSIANAYVASDYAGWAWPGNQGMTEWSAQTKPAQTSWDGSPLNLPFTNIEENDGYIFFDVDGGMRVPTPVTNEVTNVGVDWFEATWQPVGEASDYFLTVFNISEGGMPMTITADMGDGRAVTLPEGWTASSTDAYTTTGNYGEASPSIKLGKNDAWLRTCDFEADIRSISFWVKGQQNEQSVLKIVGIDADDNESELLTFEPLKNTSEIKSLDNLPQGIRAIRFDYTKVTGNVAIDDIIIVTGGEITMLPGYEHRSTGDTTTHKVEGIPAGWNDIYYYVTATDGEVESRQSDWRSVTLETNVIEAVKTNCFTVRGKTVTVNSSQAVQAYDITGRCVAQGKGTIILPESGVYIIYIEGQVAKIVIR